MVLDEFPCLRFFFHYIYQKSFIHMRYQQKIQKIVETSKYFISDF
jgi:hypothetical protein